MTALPVTEASARRELAAVWPLLIAVGLLMLGTGLQGVLVGVRSEFEGFETVVIGLVMSSYYLGFLVSARQVPVLVARVGHIRIFAAFASLASAATLAYVVLVDPVVWAAMRFVTGYCMAALYVVAESWLNEFATNQTRGRVLSAYMVVVVGGLGVGQLLIGVGDPLGFRLFVLASVLVSLSLIPLTMTSTQTPTFDLPARVSIRALYRLAPVGIIGGLGVGLSNAAVLGIGPVYGALVGMSVKRIGLFVALALAGGVALQWPIGRLSDRVPRRRVILAATVAAAVVAIAAIAAAPAGDAALGLMFIFGGLTFPMYSLAISHVNDLIPSGEVVAASSALVFVTGLGTVAGPFGAAVAISWWGAEGFWWFLAAAHALIGVFAVYRLIALPRHSADRRRRFAAVPTHGSGLAGLLWPRRHRNRSSDHDTKGGNGLRDSGSS